jgi:DNA-directed RNA polymerase subunit H
VTKKIEAVNHELVPKHEIIGESEIATLMQQYKITPKQLPRIIESDPVIKEIGAKIGDIIKITRKSPTAGESVYYRLVVEGEI